TTLLHALVASFAMPSAVVARPRRAPAVRQRSSREAGTKAPCVSQRVRGRRARAARVAEGVQQPACRRFEPFDLRARELPTPVPQSRADPLPEPRVLLLQVAVRADAAFVVPKHAFLEGDGEEATERGAFRGRRRDQGLIADLMVQLGAYA